MPSEKEKICMSQLKVSMNVTTKRWWLMSDSILKENGHPPVCPEACLANEYNATPDLMEFIEKLYNHGVIPSAVSGIMSKIVRKDFISKTKSHLVKKWIMQLM